MVMRYGRLLALTAVFLSFLATAAGAVEREIPVVTGDHWTTASEDQKKAFLLGMATILELDQEVQGTNPPPACKSLVNTWCQGLSAYSLSDLRMALDEYYWKNPDKLARPVVDVMWRELTLPNVKK